MCVMHGQLDYLWACILSSNVNFLPGILFERCFSVFTVVLYCCGFNHIHLRDVQILTPGTCKSGLIWMLGPFRSNQIVIVG